MFYTIQNNHMTVIVSENGAELQSIQGNNGTEYLWQGNNVYWSDRAPNIFPYVARLTQGAYYLDGELHKMRIHGIALYRPFRCVYHDSKRLVMELVKDETSFAEYPRRFSFQIIYALDCNKLHITFRVENHDEKTMYFGLGGHPGFNVPLEEGLSFEDYHLRFETPCKPTRIGFSEDCFLNGQDIPYPLLQDQYLPLAHSLFDEDAVVLSGTSRTVTLESINGHRSLSVSFPDMAYLGIWHMPRTDAPFVCIEPWSSLPSTKDQITVFEEQLDLLSLAPGATLNNTWSITIS